MSSFDDHGPPSFGLPLAPTLAPLVAGCGPDPRAGLDAVAALGFRHVQLSAMQPGLRPRELSGSARRDLLAALRRRGLELAGLDCWIPSTHFVDPAHADRAVSSLVTVIGLAADLGRRPVSMAVPERAPESVWSTVIGSADRHELTLANHVLPDDDRPGSRCGGLLGMGVDPAMWLAAGRDPVQAVTRNAEPLASARVVDVLDNGARVPIGVDGAGRLDVTGYKVALQVSGYVRPVVLDARGWPDPLDGVERSRRAW